MTKIDKHNLATELERIYRLYNRREFVHPDPLEFLYAYESATDREIVGLVASSLAYGRVEQILRSVSNALDRMGPHPAAFVKDLTSNVMTRAFRGFKHRFTTGEELAMMLTGARNMLKEYGSLGACFTAGLAPDDETVLPALDIFVDRLSGVFENGCCYLLPAPERKSACKRLNLYLRWMIRRDDVDPGGWDAPASKLVVPLDTHMHRIGLALGFTQRKQADLRAALEITHAFREYSPADPVKYDFALTRLGIRRDEDLGAFLDSVR